MVLCFLPAYIVTFTSRCSQSTEKGRTCFGKGYTNQAAAANTRACTHNLFNFSQSILVGQSVCCKSHTRPETLAFLCYYYYYYRFTRATTTGGTDGTAGFVNIMAMLNVSYIFLIFVRLILELTNLVCKCTCVCLDVLPEGIAAPPPDE